MAKHDAMSFMNQTECAMDLAKSGCWYGNGGFWLGDDLELHLVRQGAAQHLKKLVDAGRVFELVGSGTDRLALGVNLALKYSLRLKPLNSPSSAHASASVPMS